MNTLRQLAALTALNCGSTLHQPITLLITLVTVISMVAVPVTMVHQFGEHGRLIRDSALSLHFLFGAVIAIYGGCHSLRRDIENGTASAILSKPVSRSTYLFAKLTGLTAALTIYSCIALMSAWIALAVAPQPFIVRWGLALMSLGVPCLALIAAAVFHMRFNRRFVLVAFLGIALFQLALLLYLQIPSTNPLMAFQPDLRIIPPVALSLCSLCILSSVAISAATRLRAPQATIVCVLFLIAGLLSDSVLGTHTGSSVTTRGFFYALVPNGLHFWLADAISAGGHIPWSYVGNAALYALLYSTGLMFLARALFTQTEMPTS